MVDLRTIAAGATSFDDAVIELLAAVIEKTRRANAIRSRRWRDYRLVDEKHLLHDARRDDLNADQKRAMIRKFFVPSIVASNGI